MRLNLAILSLCTVFSEGAYFRWSEKDDDANSIFEKSTVQPHPSNLGCFLCTQLLSVTKHRVGLSQNQLRNVLYEKCRMLPVVFKDQCFSFVETSLPEIYFSLNYDFSTKDICVRLNLCDDANPFAIGGPPPEDLVTPPTVGVSQIEEEPNRRPIGEQKEKVDWIGHKNTQRKIDEERARERERERERENERENIERDRIDRLTDRNTGGAPGAGEEFPSDEKRMTCNFCERMLENAKTYAVSAKVDITTYANTVCTKMPKGRLSDQCYQMADKRIAELAKFVDQQVVEALWCAELNQC